MGNDDVAQYVDRGRKNYFLKTLITNSSKSRSLNIFDTFYYKLGQQLMKKLNTKSLRLSDKLETCLLVSV